MPHNPLEIQKSQKSCWWDGVRSGRFPKPVKIGNGRATFWKVEDILALIASA
jgi:predicted DNA-binding transcriptional regulator AlpA